jgi:polysaccharide biosynthesis protein PslG
MITIAFLVVLAAVLPLPAQAAQRGIGIPGLADQSADAREAAIAETAGELNASVLRIDLHWNKAETARGVYDDAGYLASIADTVTSAHDRGLEVIVTVYKTPKWASDSSFWTSPPQGYANGYQPFYPMTTAALDDFRAFAAHIATLLKGKVFAYECWNEPNLFAHFFPQQAKGDGLFAAHTYAKYLKQFAAGIREADPDAEIVAGATAPGMSNDTYYTSPQRFAQALKDRGAAGDFDAYSHHPYTVGGSTDIDPTADPPRPAVLVTLGNIDTLLKIWPSKPFFLTEYGYNTEFTQAFLFHVSETVQARYLRKAYAFVARRPQIKMLLWWEIQDRSSAGSTYDPVGIYTGLRALDGHRKRAWFAFARGNVITLTAPASAPRGDRVRLQGAYTCASIGGVAGRPLLLQRKWGTAAWKTLRTVTTGEAGRYTAFVTIKRASRYRLVFNGVAASPAALVRLR